MPGHVTGASPDQVWALDFVVDRTADGRPIKILTITDEHTREALATPAARRITADDTVGTLEQIVERRGTSPAYIRCDNGPELTAEALKDWCRFNYHRLLHRTRSPVAEPVHRVIQWAPTQRAPRPGLESASDSDTPGNLISDNAEPNPSRWRRIDVNQARPTRVPQQRARQPRRAPRPSLSGGPMRVQGSEGWTPSVQPSRVEMFL
jgi:hypothetical protein